MNAPKLKWLCASALMVAPLLTSCKSAPTRIFTLYGVPPQAASSAPAYAGAPVRIDSVHFPPAFDRIEVVSDVAPGEMRLNDLDHWSAPLGEVARQALSADLVARLPAGKAIFPHLRKPEGAIGVTVDVLDFKADRQGAHLEASWVLTSAGQRSNSGGGTATLRTNGLTDTNATAVAQALSALLGELADRIVAGL